MDSTKYYLDELAQDGLKKIIKQNFTKDIYIYYLLFDYETDFEDELSVEQIEVFNGLDFSVRYIRDENLDFITKFVERSFEYPFVITGEKVKFTFEKTSSFNLSKFTNLFKEHKVIHIQSGADGESILYYN